MIHVTLTPTERRVLITHSKQGANDLIRSRALAFLMHAAGQSCSGIAAVVDYHVTTVRGWLRTFERTRISSIFPHYAANQNAAKLTRAQKEDIARTLQTPDALPAELWTLPRLTEYIRAEFGVVYESDRSYHYLLKHLGFSCKLPSPVDVRRDDQAVEHTMAAIREKIKPFMASDTWAVLCVDETQVRYEEEITRAWLPKGSKTILKLSRQQAGQHYFGALNLKTGRHHLIPLDWQDTDPICQALTLIKKSIPTQESVSFGITPRGTKQKPCGSN